MRRSALAGSSRSRMCSAAACGWAGGCSEMLRGAEGRWGAADRLRQELKDFHDVSLYDRDGTWFIGMGSPTGRTRREARSGTVGARAHEESARQEALDDEMTQMLHSQMARQPDDEDGWSWGAAAEAQGVGGAGRRRRRRRLDD